ncbi:ATPase [Flavobacterium columnare]|uniref:AAA family ATPase n=1 Tax=Flavobacterium columnare TaxID=996 RepID=UPI000980F183|nr:ATP-binding protein [Flavobacterium columnare]MBF6653498.1 ATPase [Flavobacterium columnare]OOB84037.1 ATPase [Flavobacterium columnare]PTD15438.1 ATPase [Flavobacterium columnare]
MNLHNLIINDKEQISLNDIFLEKTNKINIEQLIKEHTYFDQLNKYGLPINNKILLYGSSGCGKTMTAKAIAQKLGKNILILNLSNIVSSRIGETSQNLKQIFDKAARDQAVLFLDEFDQIGKARGNDDKDVGEMRRLVNTIIQLIDYFSNKALLICATNHVEIIDTALIRRFQLQIHFTIPQKELLDQYYNNLLSLFPTNLQHIDRKYNISFAQAKDHAYNIIKSILIKSLEENQKI